MVLGDTEEGGQAKGEDAMLEAEKQKIRSLKGHQKKKGKNGKKKGGSARQPMPGCTAKRKSVTGRRYPERTTLKKVNHEQSGHGWKGKR